jgi:hypothetical protein
MLSSFWGGVILTLLAQIVVVLFLLFWRAQRRSILKWYYGLPLVWYPAMWMVAFGCRLLLAGKGAEFMKRNGRHWISPNVAGFRVPAGEEDNDV